VEQACRSASSPFWGPDANQGGGSPRWIKRAVEDSLRRLGTDHIDLYQMHRPDPNTNLEDRRLRRR
jgi:aryl-alcohol dehydrogenase-like predicted oxidoreductase